MEAVEPSTCILTRPNSAICIPSPAAAAALRFDPPYVPLASPPTATPLSGSVVVVVVVTLASYSPVPAVVSLTTEPILIAAAAVLLTTMASAPAGPLNTPG